ncbi:MAG: high-potential iron-sulfur protein [Pseudomonadota bacterium]
MNKRRILIQSISTLVAAAAAGIPLMSTGQEPAQKTAPKLDEKDPQAISLGYKHDTTKVDKQKFPKHDVSQVCSNCQFFVGKVTDPWAPCTIFAGKQVANKGWCSAWVKKTA